MAGERESGSGMVGAEKGIMVTTFQKESGGGGKGCLILGPGEVGGGPDGEQRKCIVERYCRELFLVKKAFGGCYVRAGGDTRAAFTQ